MHLTKQIQMERKKSVLVILISDTSDKRMAPLEQCIGHWKNTQAHRSTGTVTELMDCASKDDLSQLRDIRNRLNEQAPDEPPTFLPPLAGGYNLMEAALEIDHAIKTVVGETEIARKSAQTIISEHKQGSITVLPTMPEFRYLYTCPQCGCHVQATLRIGGTSLKICSGCNHVASVYS